MSTLTPSIPKGTRDFSAKELEQRHYIIDVITSQFRSFCFEPLETPAFENLSTLTGNYGEEGDRLMFKILNSGDFLANLSEDEYTQKDPSRFSSKISEKALRYDLTVPFSRYVAMNHSNLTFPFKRYQIQPVWRADRPQKGRFREFYQCDADVVGSQSLWQEIELIQLYDAVFSKLNLPVIIKLNHRKILSGMADAFGITEKLTVFMIVLDKLAKIGKDGVVLELKEKGLSAEAISKLAPLLDFTGNSSQALLLLKGLLETSAGGQEGLNDLEFIIKHVNTLGLKSSTLVLDLTLARGLHYYTGSIFEVVVPGLQLGSVGGGGRYDNLTACFGLKNMSGIGISFGLDRIDLALAELKLFPDTLNHKPRTLVLNFGAHEAQKAFLLGSKFREMGLEVEFYPDDSKIKKQMTYANKKGISHVVIIGESELKSDVFRIKIMETGQEQQYRFSEIDRAIENAYKRDTSDGRR